MKKLTKIASGVLAIGVLMATGVTTFAATNMPANTDTDSSNTAISNIEEGKRPMHLGHGKARRDHGNMERPELTDDQKAEMAENMKERLAEQLKDGNISQEEYDQAISDIEEGKRPMHLGHSKTRKSNQARGQAGLCDIEKPEVTDQ